MGNRRFHRVAVLMGGPSAERKVSLRGGRAVTQGLREAGYEVTPVAVNGRTVDLPPGTDAVFLVLHGEFGEDGEVQAWLDARGIPYTGSGAAASRLAFDKILCKQVLRTAGIPTPDFEVLHDGEVPTLGWPAVVKPPRQGSSLGVARVEEAADWPAARRKARRYDAELLLERYVPGQELTVGIVGDEVLPVVEIVAPNGSYDYRAKYTPGVSRYLVPAPLSKADTNTCQDLAWRSYAALGCRGLGRVDLRGTPQEGWWVLELNSIPGFTRTSLLPMAAAQAGWSFSDLCARILELARTG